MFCSQADTVHDKNRNLIGTWFICTTTPPTLKYMTSCVVIKYPIYFSSNMRIAGHIMNVIPEWRMCIYKRRWCIQKWKKNRFGSLHNENKDIYCTFVFIFSRNKILKDYLSTCWFVNCGFPWSCFQESWWHIYIQLTSWFLIYFVIVLKYYIRC